MLSALQAALVTHFPETLIKGLVSGQNEHNLAALCQADLVAGHLQK
jgi:hypothetical protein